MQEVISMTWQNWIGLLVIISVCYISLSPQLAEKANKSFFAKKLDQFWQIVANKFYRYVVILFMLMGAGVRLWKFGIIPAGFNQDGAMGAVDALALAHHGTDRFGMWLPVHFTAWGFGQMSVLLSYLSTPFIAVFGLNRYTARIAVVIISMLGLWALYALCKLVMGRGVALTALAFCAINPWHIMQSRWTLDCNMLPHFFLFSVYFLCLALKKKKKYLYVSMIFFGLSMYTYGIAWYTVPLFLLAAAMYLFRKNIITFKEAAISAAVYLLAAWPIFGVMLVNIFKFSTISTPFLTIPYFPGTRRTSDLLFFSGDFFKQLANNFETTMNLVILQKPDLPWNTIPEYGTVYLFTVPFLLMGLVELLNRMFEKDEKVKAIDGNAPQSETENGKYRSEPIVLWFFIAFLSGLMINGVNVNRINIVFYPVIIVCSIGIYSLVKRVRLLGIVVLLIYTIAFAGFGSSYFGQHSQIVGAAFYNGFGEAMEYVKDLEYDVINITNRTQSENSWWVSEPLALFHHQVDALYFQGKADLYSKRGKKLLPYKERYKYVRIQDLTIDPRQNAVYIVHNDEISKFDYSKFKIVKFALYSAVIPIR
jgi:4-amino-4-deoxy-L-arabinose transferase-like glycosyltransferase